MSTEVRVCYARFALHTVVMVYAKRVALTLSAQGQSDMFVRINTQEKEALALRRQSVQKFNLTGVQRDSCGVTI